MQFEWDDHKAAQNVFKHGVPFEYAVRVFLDPHRLDNGRPTNANRGNTTKHYRLDPKKPRQLTPAEARRLDATPIDYSDIPPLGDEFFIKATEAWPPTKRQLTIRLDADVLKWLKANGKGYQTRINRILRAVMESQPPRRSRSTPAPKENTRSRSALKRA